MDLGLKGKIALVVAASKGMGKACALGLAAEGARVVMCARGEAALNDAAAEVKRQTGAEVLALTADASRAAGHLEGRGGGATEACGGVDILVANVGGPPPGPFEQMTDEHWTAAFEQVHLSTVRFIREVLPHMKKTQLGPHPGHPVQLGQAAGGRAGPLQRHPARHRGPLQDPRGRSRQGRHHGQPGPARPHHDRPLHRAPDGPGQARRDHLEAADRRCRSTPTSPWGGSARRRSSPTWWSSSASARASYVTGTVVQVDGGLIRSVV